MSSEHNRIGRRLAEDPIAIIGLSGLFPMAHNHRDYWQNIVDGKDCTSDVPESRWRLADHYDPDPDAKDKTYSRRGAFLPDVEFDPLEFGLPPNQLDVTSTLQTLSLGVARDVLRDAGAVDSTWYDPSRTGVVLGVTGPVPLMHPLAARLSTPVLKEVIRAAGLTESDAEEIAERYVRAFAPWEENSFPGFLPNVVAGRIANRLDLGGMNTTVDAACAASLSALRTAIAELVDRRADMMIAGGADTENTIFVYLSFSKVGALSRSGRVQPFSDDADGTLIGEGIGMVALRRLADAERDGNRIYAVIRGIGSSSDGRAKSIYAPRREGQLAALDRAYEDADCSPDSVELFEAHATGTAVGDRTELTALRDLLAKHSTETQVAAIGSVKSQIGHTKGAAGAASLIKLALGLYHKNLPPTINVERPNSGIDFDSAPFYINVKNRPWIRDPHRPVRRAAASAMGFGGTNFHVVLEEHHGTRSAIRNLHRTARAHLWHAPDPAALIALLNGDAPSNDGGPVPEDHARIGFVAIDGPAEVHLRALAAERLAADPDIGDWSHPQGVYYRRRGLAGLKVGALFAGQGSQYLDMGLEAALNIPTVAGAFDDANAQFDGRPTRLARVVFPPPVFDAGQRQEQEATLRRTEYAQPAIGALAAGQYRFLRELGLIGEGFLGHSFGELTALWAADSLSDVDFFRLAAARGTAMAPVPGMDDPGTMAAVSAARERVQELLAAHPGVVVCNHNAPDQVVVGGGTDAVDAFVAACTGQGITARRLPVSAAFHTGYVEHAVPTFREAVATARIGAPAAPVYANSACAGYGADPAANADTLTAQLMRPVEFVDAVRTMHTDGVTVFVEFGPKQVLTGLVRRILDGTDVVALATDAGPLGDADVALKQAAVRLVVLGAPLTGINRYDAPPLVTGPTRPGGMTVTLSAPEYVPPARAAAYQEGLNDGFRVSVAPAAHHVNGARTHPLQEEPSMTAHTTTTHAGPDDPAAQHLALHARYLDSQLHVAETLIGLVVEHGTGDPRLGQIVESVKDQSVAIGHAHARAADVLARLTELEHGVGPSPDPIRYEPPAARRTYVEQPAVPRYTAVAGNGHLPSTPALTAPAPVPAPVTAPVAPPAPATVNVAEGTDPGVVRDALIAVVADKTGYSSDLVDPTMDLEADLGVDSIKRVQVIGAIQERFPHLPTVGPEQLGELRTLNQIVDFLLAEAGGVDPKASSPVAEPGPGTTTVLRRPITLVDLPAIDTLTAPYPTDAAVVLLDRGGSGATALAASLRSREWTVRRIDLSTMDLGQSLAVTTGRVDLVLAVLDDGPAGTDLGWAQAEQRLTEAILIAGFAHRVLTPDAGRRAGFVTLTRLDGGVGLHGTADPARNLLGGVGGVVKTLAAEAPMLFCRAVDINPDVDPATAATALLAELHDAATDALEVGIDAAGDRHTVVPGRHGSTTASTVDLSAVPRPRLENDDLFVVTGGGRGVTALCVRALAALRPIGFLLLGRTELVDEPAWALGVPDAGLKAAVITALKADGGRPSPKDVERRHADLAAQREIRSTLDHLHGSGATATYLAVDVADPDAVRAALRGHPVTGIVHGAGILADALLPDKTVTQIRTVFAPKLGGLAAVLSAVETDRLRHVVLFTSVAGLLGNPGQADYAAANEALVRFAASWRQRYPAKHVTAVAWGAWDGGMVNADLRAMFTARGVWLLDPEVGARAFVEQFTSDHLAESRVLIGDDRPLGTATFPVVSPFAAHRDLRGVPEHEVLLAHRIGGHPVLPATFGLGWLVNVAERAHPGQRVVRARDFQVYRGIVFDGTITPRHHLEVGDIRQESGRTVLRATVRGDAGGARPSTHYAATLELAVGPDPAPRVTLDASGAGAEDAHAIYTGAVQFHGPALQGMREILEFTDERFVVRCRLSDVAVSGGAFAGALHGPMRADLLLQGSSVLGSRLLGQACLPLAIAVVDFYAPLPEEFVVMVDDLRAAPGGVLTTATAIDPSGRVLQRFTDITLVSTPDMAAKFAESVTHWLPTTGTDGTTIVDSATGVDGP